MYTIKEAAQQTGLTEYSLRFYTDRGLIPAIQLGYKQSEIV